jgi:hypothetical protein
MIALTVHFDPAQHVRSHYQSKVENILAAYHNDVEKVGYRSGPSSLAAIRILGPSPEQSRVAICSRARNPLGDHPPYLYQFDHWVSDGFADLAEEAQEFQDGRLLAKPEEKRLTVRHDDPGLHDDTGEVSKWVKSIGQARRAR